jgi:hypothetical protein
MTETERGLSDREGEIGEMIQLYKTARSQNEKVLRRALKRVDVATQHRVEVQRGLKRAAGNVSTVKAEIIANGELLDSYRRYGEFLNVLAMMEGNIAEEVFREPSELLERLDYMERGNLMLIQACQKLDENVEAAREHYAELLVRCNELLEIGEAKKVGMVQDSTGALSDGTIAHARAQDSDYERVSEKVEQTYRRCFGIATDLPPLRLLERLEGSIEEFYQRLPLIRPEFIAMKQAEHEKQRREKQRVDKQLSREADQKVKMEHAMYRATRPIERRTGRPLVPRHLPFMYRVVEDKAAIAAMREQRRIQALLFEETED